LRYADRFTDSVYVFIEQQIRMCNFCGTPGSCIECASCKLTVCATQHGCADQIGVGRALVENENFRFECGPCLFRKQRMIPVSSLRLFTIFD
jgi:hypothetical protein